MDKNYTVTRKVIDFEISLKLSYEELVILRDSLNQLARDYRGLPEDVKELRNLFDSAIADAEGRGTN